MRDFLIVTCEHGGNRVPAAYAGLFRPHRRILDSHRGYDPGSLELARACARRLKAPLHFATVTRLLVELNRSKGHQALFSAITKSLPQAERDVLLRDYYFPYRQRIEADLARAIADGRRAVHFSIHTFTPKLDRKVRRADVGLLYDPRRPGEAIVCKSIRQSLQLQRPDLLVRMNYPYGGKADGFTTTLRTKWPADSYVGIEIEVNQKWPLGDRRTWRRLVSDLSISIESAVGEPSARKVRSR
ncbi:MAG TPA: N-formylglutamate amidohydrolase [Planctomycetaceae bacterium]|nr:N-formylglutamate amidohydrolase [Planctomycetaceae bacterium]